MIIDGEVYLAHFGIKGMKWGVRRDLDDVSSRTNREARKDAEEFARAKMFFGEGAGTRRKLINSTVEAKKKKSESYAKAFDHHLSNQDMSRHASKASSERKRKDRAQTTKRSAGYLARQATGEMGTAAALTAVGVAGVAFLNSDKGRAIMRTGMNRVTNLVDEVRRKKNARYIRTLLDR